jgi:hypothetical protein
MVIVHLAKTLPDKRSVLYYTVELVRLILRYTHAAAHLLHLFILVETLIRIMKDQRFALSKEGKGRQHIPPGRVFSCAEETLSVSALNTTLEGIGRHNKERQSADSKQSL